MYLSTLSVYLSISLAGEHPPGKSRLKMKVTKKVSDASLTYQGHPNLYASLGGGVVTLHITKTFYFYSM